jgi:hypothetical protein
MDTARMLRQVTQPPHIAGPLGISIDAPARMTNKKYLY